MKRILLIITLSLISLFAINSCVVSKRASQMTTYSVTIHSTQVMTAVMSIGTRKMNVNFPYRTTINPAKTTTMIFDAPGYHPYSLVIPPGTDQSYYNIVFTEDPGGNNRD
jgi:hypothetical protein